ncbi:transcription factor Adf-1-like isoform X1 [Macrobrachium rosenbergii]|uniref:transcription factor Adf-1-like isoform X1 n=1 Tax=Macrobrachium rosenbergii TaxID=79674 RepID=UPI0034D6907A
MDDIDDEAIIEAVKLHKAIYDRTKNTNRKAIDGQWKKIAEELGVDEACIRRRWSCLRDYFLFQHKILLGKKTGKHGKRKKKWPLYDKMAFLIPQLRSRQDIQALTSAGQNSNQNEIECNSKSTVFHPSDRNKSDLVSIESSVVLPVEPDFMEPLTKIQHTAPAKSLKTCLSSQGNFYSFRDSANLDDDTHFIMSLLPMMRKLDPLTRLEFRIEVQSLLLRCQKKATSASPDEPPRKITVWSSQH